MKSTLTITTKTTNELRRELQRELNKSGLELETRIKTNMRESNPAGRTYRLSGIRVNRPRAGARRSTLGGFVIGSNFYRASAPGQPPAIRFGNLINSIFGRPSGFLQYEVATNLLYGAILDDPDGLNRPFFASQVRLYEPRFFDNINSVLDF